MLRVLLFCIENQMNKNQTELYRICKLTSVKLLEFSFIGLNTVKKNQQSYEKHCRCYYRLLLLSKEISAG